MSHAILRGFVIDIGNESGIELQFIADAVQDKLDDVNIEVMQVFLHLEKSLLCEEKGRFSNEFEIILLSHS